MEAVFRSALYELLSRSVSYPTAERMARLHAEIVPLLRAVQSDEPELNGALAALLASTETPIGTLQSAYNCLFSHITSSDCPAYETAFSSRDVFQQAQVMADVAGFYRAHGVRVGGEERERPDHIGPELGFMGFMARKEAYALKHLAAERVDECYRTQATFLRDHLGCWGPALGLRVSQLASAPFYRDAGRLISVWLRADMRRLGVRPAHSRDEAQPFPEPADDTCGTDAGDCALDCGFSAGVAAAPGPGRVVIDPASIR